MIRKAQSQKLAWEDLYHDLYCIGAQFANHHKDTEPSQANSQIEQHHEESPQFQPTLDPGLLELHYGEQV